MEKTYKELDRLDNAVAEMFKKYPDLISAKFGYHYRIFHEKNLKLVFSEYNKALAHIRIDYALVNPATKALMVSGNPRGFEYSKEGLKEVMDAESNLENEWQDKKFEIEPYMIGVENIPNITFELTELSKGILI